MNFSNAYRRNESQSFRAVLAWLCVLLILLVGAAQLLHTHAGDEASGSSCSLCAVAHCSALPAPAVAEPLVVETVQPLRHVTPMCRSLRHLSFELYVRPPPALTTYA